MKKIIILFLSFITFVYSSNKLNKITNMNEFSYFIQTYYLHPQPELINDAIKFLDTSKLVSRKNTKALLLASFSCIFSKYNSKKKEKWKNLIESLQEPTKSLLRQSINKTPSEILESVPLSPKKNDMNWACFFITEDNKYLNEIISSLQYLEERNNVNLFLTASSAKWSLSSNAKRHFKVRIVLEAIKVGDVPSMRLIAKEMINGDLKKMREETVSIVKEQNKKGIWLRN
jgi:hypothetical protein